MAALDFPTSPTVDQIYTGNTITYKWNGVSWDSVNAITLSGAVTGSGNSTITTSLGSFTSLQLATALTDKTGTGLNVFGTSPTFLTDIKTPLIIGGTGTTSTLIHKTTSGVGATGADHIFQVGNNGATEAMRILNNGNLGVGTASPTAVLHLKAGTSTANTAPLKLTSGILLTTAETGAVEFLTDAYYGTITTGTARKQFLFTDGSAANLTGLPAAQLSGAIPSTVTATTQTANDNSTKIATTAYVDTKPSGSSFWTSLAGATRVSNTTFTVTSDQTALIAKGMIIKWTESAVVRVAMVSIPSTFSTTTTVTIIGDTMTSIDASSLKYAMIGAEAFIKNFALAGNIGAIATDVMNSYRATEPMRVIGSDVSVGTAGTTNSTTFDINKNGTTMFTTKPTLATTVASSPTPFTADTATSLALADRVSIDIDAIQTTNAIDGYITLYLFPTRYINLT